MTQNKYLTKMANTIIDDDTGNEFNYRQLSKNPKHKKIYVNNLSLTSTED